jgi:hypothetical protein
MTNIAGLAQVPATFLERYCGFWTAYLLGAAALWATLTLLLLYRSSFGKSVPFQTKLSARFPDIRDKFAFLPQETSYLALERCFGVPPETDSNWTGRHLSINWSTPTEPRHGVKVS